MLYTLSVYFPFKNSKLVDFVLQYENPTKWASYALLLLATIFFSVKWGVFTGMVIWLFAVMGALVVLIIGIPVAHRLLNTSKNN